MTDQPDCHPPEPSESSLSMPGEKKVWSTPRLLRLPHHNYQEEFRVLGASSVLSVLLVPPSSARTILDSNFL